MGSGNCDCINVPIVSWYFGKSTSYYALVFSGMPIIDDVGQTIPVEEAQCGFLFLVRKSRD